MLDHWATGTRSWGGFRSGLTTASRRSKYTSPPQRRYFAQLILWTCFDSLGSRRMGVTVFPRGYRTGQMKSRTSSPIIRLLFPFIRVHENSGVLIVKAQIQLFDGALYASKSHFTARPNLPWAVTI